MTVELVAWQFARMAETLFVVGGRVGHIAFPVYVFQYVGYDIVCTVQAYGKTCRFVTIVYGRVHLTIVP